MDEQKEHIEEQPQEAKETEEEKKERLRLRRKQYAHTYYEKHKDDCKRRTKEYAAKMDADVRKERARLRAAKSRAKKREASAMLQMVAV